MKKYLLTVFAVCAMNLISIAGWAGMPEIKDGVLTENGKPLYLYGGMPPDAFFSKFQGLRLNGLASDPRFIYKESTEPSADMGPMRSKISEKSRSGIYTELLWGHMMPEWAIGKWHTELKGGTGFSKSNFLAAPAVSLNIAGVQYALERLRPEFPFSVDMGNELAFNGNFYGTAQSWQSWLENRYKSIDSLNSVWRTSYSSFPAVDPPDFVTTEWSRPFKVITGTVSDSKFPIYHDWTIFNRWRVTQWIRDLANAVRSKAPQTKIHLKMFPNSFFRVDAGVSPLDIVQISDFAGCDTWTWPIGSGRWAFEWQDTWMWMDMLRSVNPVKPLFNSENHFFRDGKDKPGSWAFPAPEEYFYAALMGEAIHGQYATLIWGRWKQGNVQDRPEAMRGIQRAINDTNRLSEQITLLASIRPHVKILFSTSTMIAESAKMSNDEKVFYKSPYVNKMRAVYEELITSGVPLAFVFEDLPLGGQVSSEDVVIVPGTSHLSRSTVYELTHLAEQGTIVVIFNSPLNFDEYGRQMNAESLLRQKSVINAKGIKDIVNIIRKKEGTSPVSVYENGNESADIEWRYTRNNNDIYVFLLNHSNQAKHISIKSGNVQKAIEMINNRSVDLKDIAMQSLDVKLIKLSL